MRIVIQRVLEAQVEVDGRRVGQIDNGLLVYVSVGKTDTFKDAQFIAEKLANLRIFPDENGKMNRSVLDIGGSILLISNFTLHDNCKKGRRPGFDSAQRLYEKLIELTAKQGVVVERGVFGGHMHVSSINDGPVTFLLES